MASVAICTAVSKPKVTSVPARSLSIVFGTPTTLTPWPPSRSATPRVSSPPMATRASIPWAAKVATTCCGPPSVANGLVPTSQDRPPEGHDVAAPLGGESHRLVQHDALPAVEETHGLVAMDDGPGQNHSPDHRIQAGAVSPAGQDSETHRSALP